MPQMSWAPKESEISALTYQSRSLNLLRKALLDV